MDHRAVIATAVHRQNRLSLRLGLARMNRDWRLLSPQSDRDSTTGPSLDCRKLMRMSRNPMPKGPAIASACLNSYLPSLSIVTPRSIQYFEKNRPLRVNKPVALWRNCKRKLVTFRGRARDDRFSVP